MAAHPAASAAVWGVLNVTSHLRAIWKHDAPLRWKAAMVVILALAWLAAEARNDAP